MNVCRCAVLLSVFAVLSGLCGCQHAAGGGAVRNLGVYGDNPHYFADAGGKPLLLIGDYTWGTFSDANYDYASMLDEIAAHRQNFARVWLWWGSGSFPAPHNKTHIDPYLRPGPGTANDGLLRYDLDRFNPAFFARLQQVCRAARSRGITLQLVLFDAWMIKHAHLWKLHAYCAENNANGVDGDPARTGRGTDGKRGFCSMGNPEVLERQKAYIRRVIEAVDPFDNVLLEIANENFYSKDWETHLCEYIHAFEKDRPRRHLVMPLDLPHHLYGGIQTYDIRKMHRQILKALPLNQPIIFDTDGILYPKDEIVRKAVWTAFVSGANADYLDESMQPDGKHHGDFRGTARETLRRQLGYLAAFAHQTRFWEMHPADDRLMEGFAFLSASDGELVAYFPEGGESLIDFAGHTVVSARWYNPRNGTYTAIPHAGAGGPLAFLAPTGEDWVLRVRMR